VCCSRPIHHDRYVGSPAADVDEATPSSLLVGREHGLSRGKLLKHQVRDPQPGLWRTGPMFCAAEAAPVIM